ncbi:hypothetical protein GE09DRAFT_1253082 [Coniochaeta sp. 2T2.1]|nr:hypothetical protein GE09DRAFT_1253082 [Coniochaeta sp. 2T2.1]
MLLNFFLTVLSSILATAGATQSTKDHGKHPVDFKARNLKTIQSIYNLTTFPKNVPILTNGTDAVPPGLFNANATGRITPIGNFSGFADSAEYFFALTLIPSAQNNFTAFFEADIVAFTSECPEIATSVVYLNTSNLDPQTGRPTSDNFFALKQIAMWRFDSAGAVLQYEAWIPNLALYSSSAIGGEFSSSGTPAGDEGIIKQLCPVIQQECVGPNQEYDSVDDCVGFMSGRAFGNFDEVWGDNVVCRSLHTILARLRPTVHCPHVGKVGGSEAEGFKCTNIKYTVDYFDDQKLFGGDGHPFFCDAKNQYHHIRREVEGPGDLN